MSYTEEFLGYNWIRRHSSLTIPEHYEIQLISPENWKHLRNLRNSLHMFITNIKEPEYAQYIERDLNELLCGQFGSLQDYNITMDKVSMKVLEEGTKERTDVYRIIGFHDGLIPLVIVDMFEKDQKSITDTHPTSNPGCLRVGVVMSNGDLFDMLTPFEEYKWNYDEDYGLDDSSSDDEDD